MNNDNTFWLTLWLFILAAVVAIALGVAGIVTAHYNHMAELGYEETVVPGQCSPVWKKAASARIEVKCNCPSDGAILTITNWCQAASMSESPVPGYAVKNGWLVPEEARHGE